MAMISGEKSNEHSYRKEQQIDDFDFFKFNSTLYYAFLSYIWDQTPKWREKKKQKLLTNFIMIHLAITL